MKHLFLFAFLHTFASFSFAQVYATSDTIVINNVEYIIKSLGTSGATFDRKTNLSIDWKPASIPDFSCLRLTMNEALIKTTIESVIPLSRRNTIRQSEKKLGMFVCVSPSTGKIVEISFGLRTYSVVTPQELAQIEVALLGKTVSGTHPLCTSMLFLQKLYVFEW